MGLLFGCAQCCALMSFILTMRLIDNLVQSEVGYAMNRCLWSLSCSLLGCLTSTQVYLSLYIGFSTWYGWFGWFDHGNILASRNCQLVYRRMISLTAGQKLNKLLSALCFWARRRRRRHWSDELFLIL